MRLPQQGMPPCTDLREMLRGHIVGRALVCVERAEARRAEASVSREAMATYREAVRAAVRGFYRTLPAGAGAPPPRSAIRSWPCASATRWGR